MSTTPERELGFRDGARVADDLMAYSPLARTLFVVGVVGFLTAMPTFLVAMWVNRVDYGLPAGGVSLLAMGSFQASLWLAEREKRAAYPEVVESADQRAVTIVLHRRPDGGLRVHSTDLPGLGLSGADPAQVLEDIGPAIRVLLEHQGLWPEYRTPGEPA